jgi:lactoylglutathione lyase
MTVNSVMTNLYTDDLESAVAFYRDVLGGTETFRVADHVELRLGDTILAVSSRAAVVRDGLPALTTGHPMELVVWCDSADDTTAKARAAGAPVLLEPNSGNWLAVVSKE